MELDEKTNLIKQYLKSWSNNTIEIGKILFEIKEKKIYKQKYNTFEEYISSAFDFKRMMAYNYIKIFEKYGQNVQRLDKMKDFGIQPLIMSLSVPDDYFEEMVVELEEKKKEGYKVTELAQSIKKFSTQSGSRERCPNEEEHLLKLKRQAQSIKDDFERFREIKVSLILSIENWLKTAKYSELDYLKEDLNIIMVDLK